MKYKSEACEALYEHAVELYKIGAITEERMREYDELCLKNPKTKKQASVCNDNNVKLKIAGHATA